MSRLRQNSSRHTKNLFQTTQAHPPLHPRSHCMVMKIQMMILQSVLMILSVPCMQQVMRVNFHRLEVDQRVSSRSILLPFACCILRAATPSQLGFLRLSPAQASQVQHLLGLIWHHPKKKEKQKKMRMTKKGKKRDQKKNIATDKEEQTK